VGTGAMGKPSDIPSPFAVLTPMRRPVKDPGPIDTASPSRSDGRQPASASRRSTAAITRSEWVTRTLSVYSPTIASPSASAAPPASVEVSIAKSFTARPV